MAKHYRRRRYYRSKGRWSANIKTLTSRQISVPSNTSFYAIEQLCQNPAQVDTTVSQQYTVKNIELNYELECGAGLQPFIEGLVAYIVYVPQGMTVTETYPNFHPEYIMAMRFLGSPNADDTASGNQQPGRNPLRIKTRLSRRLQTGDSVQLLIIGRNGGTSAGNLDFNGIVRWWTKAN